MSAQQNVITAPGKSISMKMVASPPPANAKFTAFTSAQNFDTVKHLLSDRPLRGPIRTRPIE